MDAKVEAAGADESRVDELGAVGGGEDKYPAANARGGRVRVGVRKR